jgi:hypothetical protein
MRWLTVTSLLLALVIANTSAEWSWGGDAKDNDKDAKPEEKTTELLQGEEGPDAEKKSSDSEGTVLDDIVDELVNNRQQQGRSLGGFDDVYSDPTIKEALDSGDDAEARNLIKGRLCTLGLIQVSN